MRLSERHVAVLAREIADPGHPDIPGFRPATDADYAELQAKIISETPPEGLWVFAYGSLIWNPAFEYTERRHAIARGWRRTFCLGWDRRFRGNPDQPGLMLALDRGGQCAGVVYKITSDNLEKHLDTLIRREMSMVPSAFPARWVKASTPHGPVRALTFAMNRNSGRYISGLDDDAMADILSRACGFRGSMADYLYATVRQLEELGIHDRYLWRLQDKVAERIERHHSV